MLITGAIYISSLALLAASVAYSMAKTQGFVSSLAQAGVSRQPSSAHSMGKSHFLLLVLFEAPALLSGVCAGYAMTLISIQAPLLALSIFFLIVSLAVVAISTVKYSSAPSSAFLLALAAHPQNSSQVANNALIFLSLMQTPLIFSLVSVFFAVVRLKSAITLPWITFFMMGMAPLLIAITGCGLLRGMNMYITEIALVAHYLPHAFRKILGEGLVALALIEAPLLLSFVIAMFVMTLDITNTFSSGIIIISALILFGVVAAVVSYQSASSAALAVAHWRKNYIIKESITRLSFLSQVLLDTRVLYMFVVVLLILFQCAA